MWGLHYIIKSNATGGLACAKTTTSYLSRRVVNKRWLKEKCEGPFKQTLQHCFEEFRVPFRQIYATADKRTITIYSYNPN